jgi:osmotically-inducible protein OsmY
MKRDDLLRHDVETELNWEPSIDAHAIALSVQDGIVTLMGHVRHYLERSTAERVAERVKGVRGVANEIVVDLPGDHSDADIVSSVAHALDVAVHVPTDQVTPVVRDGCVTLDGEVEWNFRDWQWRKPSRSFRGFAGL